MVFRSTSWDGEAEEEAILKGFFMFFGVGPVVCFRTN